MRSSRFHIGLALGAAALMALPCDAEAAKGRKNLQLLEEVAPWAVEPDRIKLEIVERLVLEKRQYHAALPLIAAMRAEGVNAPVLDLLQGVAMREEGLLDEAESMLLNARKRMSSDARVHEALCVLYADRQALEVAIASCEKATRLDDTQSSSWNNLGFLYLASDRPAEAVDAIGHAIALDGTNARYRNNMAMAHVANGQIEQALGLLRTTSPEADSYHDLGAAIERYQSEADALPWYEKSLKVDPQHVHSARAIERIKNPDSTEMNP